MDEILTQLRRSQGMTALLLREVLGLTHEAVYVELVRLEAAGLATVRAWRGKLAIWDAA